MRTAEGREREECCGREDSSGRTGEGGKDRHARTGCIRMGGSAARGQWKKGVPWEDGERRAVGGQGKEAGTASHTRTREGVSAARGQWKGGEECCRREDRKEGVRCKNRGGATAFPAPQHACPSSISSSQPSLNVH